MNGLTSFTRGVYSGCQICCNCSRLKPGFNVWWGTMPQINIIPDPVTLNWRWPMVNA